MKAFEAKIGKSKVILEEYDFGTYAIYYADEMINVSTRDDLYDDLSEAMKSCWEDYGILKEKWNLLQRHQPIMVTR